MNKSILKTGKQTHKKTVKQTQTNSSIARPGDIDRQTLTHR